MERISTAGHDRERHRPGGCATRGETPLWWRLGVSIALLAGTALVLWFFTLFVVGQSGDSTCFGWQSANRMRTSYFPPQFECIRDGGAQGPEIETHSAALVLGVVGIVDVLALGLVAAISWRAIRTDGPLGWSGSSVPDG